jgi:pantoate--beta-alanine ligase
MHVFDNISNTRQYLSGQKAHDKTIGFVPTMGALHEGHLELMRRAKSENDILAVSVFVNPIQFNNPEDLKKYPRDLVRDSALLEQVGCDVLFAPTVDEMYPAEEETKQFDFGPLEKVMEGAFRPGHFNGVAVVVEKLFDIIRPDKAYFGEKDFQQLAIIHRLVAMEDIPVTIVPCPTIREDDGLAMSSRNARLTEDERAVAPLIHKTLLEAVQKSKYATPDEVRLMVKNIFSDQPEFGLEYFEIADEVNLQPVSNWSDSQGIVGFIAAHLGKVRLIDNIRFI